MTPPTPAPGAVPEKRAGPEHDPGAPGAGRRVAAVAGLVAGLPVQLMAAAQRLPAAAVTADRLLADLAATVNGAAAVVRHVATLVEQVEPLAGRVERLVSDAENLLGGAAVTAEQVAEVRATAIRRVERVADLEPLLAALARLEPKQVADGVDALRHLDLSAAQLDPEVVPALQAVQALVPAVQRLSVTAERLASIIEHLSPGPASTG